MPTDVVELKEIVNIQGDANNAYGSTPGGTDVVVPFNQGIQFLSQAARMKADADQFKYLQFQQNMKDFYKNFDEIKVDGIMEADYPIINEEYATLARDLANNYDVIRNPSIDPEKYAELKQREAQLRGNIQRSKQELAFRDFNNEFMKVHPEFNTSENQSMLSDFNTKTIGERKLFNLNTPFVYNPADRAKVANTVAQEKLKVEQLAGKYITTEEATRYVEEEYDKAWDALGNQQDKTGRTVYQSAQDAFTKLPSTVTGGRDFLAYDRELGRSLMLQDERSNTIRPDQANLQEDAQAFEASQQAKRLASNERVASIRADDKEIRGGGRLYNNMLGDFTQGIVRPDIAQNLFGDNSEVEVTNRTGGGVDPMTGLTVPTEERKTKVPRIQVTRTYYDPVKQKLIAERVDNSSGTPVKASDFEIDYRQATQLYTNILGPKYADKIASAAEDDRGERRLTRRVPVQSELETHFRQPGQTKEETGANKKKVYDPTTGKYIIPK